MDVQYLRYKFHFLCPNISPSENLQYWVIWIIYLKLNILEDVNNLLLQKNGLAIICIKMCSMNNRKRIFLLQSLKIVKAQPQSWFVNLEFFWYFNFTNNSGTAVFVFLKMFCLASCNKAATIICDH